MNILFYDAKAIKLPDPMDSDSDDNPEPNINEYNLNSDKKQHFISIMYDDKFRKGQYIDIYASLFSDFTSKIIIHLNEQ
jgi:hypothetical protein